VREHAIEVLQGIQNSSDSVLEPPPQTQPLQDVSHVGKNLRFDYVVK
jgi:hypothetical protein